jgi:hypothetical protein
MVYFTHKPEQAKQTYLREGEWDAILPDSTFLDFDRMAQARFELATLGL